MAGKAPCCIRNGRGLRLLRDFPGGRAIPWWALASPFRRVRSGAEMDTDSGREVASILTRPARRGAGRPSAGTRSPNRPANPDGTGVILGYHGLSSRSRSHRQSVTAARGTQALTPRLPARWATADSGAMTRSNEAHDRRRVEEVAAVVSPRPAVGQHRDGEAARQLRELFAPLALLQADQPDSGQLRQMGEMGQGEGAPAVDAIAGVPLPRDADLEDPTARHPEPPRRADRPAPELRSTMGRQRSTVAASAER